MDGSSKASHIGGLIKSGLQIRGSTSTEERLQFVQQSFSPVIVTQANAPYPAEAPSPVWDLMNAYKEYITERETFLGRKPDLGGLVQAIVEANNAIIEDKQDVLDSINKMGAAAKTIIDSTSGIRAAADSI